MKWSEEDMKEVIMHVRQHHSISAAARLHGVKNYSKRQTVSSRITQLE